MTDPITVITPTGDRPEALTLLSRWMDRQRYDGEIQWVVVDDGTVPFEPVSAKAAVTYVRRDGTDGFTGTSFQRNLLTAMQHVQHDKIVFAEDDDWYAPTYLSTMSQFLDRYELVGEGYSRYYNVRYRKWLQIGNTKHASLCQTGFRRGLTDAFVATVRTRENFIDMQFWKHSCRKIVVSSHGLCVGIKGMPGRPGIGIGHRPNQRRGFTSDVNMSKLNLWVGDDSEVYSRYYDPATASMREGGSGTGRRSSSGRHR